MKVIPKKYVLGLNYVSDTNLPKLIMFEVCFFLNM